MNFNTSRKRHQMISVEIDENDSKELPQLMQPDELESAVKKMKCDETCEDANIEPSDNCNVENDSNLDMFDLPPTPLLFEPISHDSQEKLAMDVDTQSACSLSLIENKVSEKKPISKKMSLRTNFIFNPYDFVDDPEERKLPDLRSNRADPIGYVALYPRKGEKLTEECRKIYSDRMQKEFDSIQETKYRQQRKSLTYIKWGPPIEIPLEDRISSLSLSERINAKRSCTVSNEAEIFTNEIDDRFEDEQGDDSFKGQAGQSQVLKATFKLQVDDDDDEDFLPYRSKRTGNRKKNRGGQKNANKNLNIASQVLSKPVNKKSNQEKKAGILDIDEDVYTFDISELNPNREKSLPKTCSRSQVNRGGTSRSLLNRCAVQEDIESQVQSSEDDNDGFKLVQNQKRKTRKNTLPFKKSYPGKKVNLLDYPDCNNDAIVLDDTYGCEFPKLNSSTQKNPPKISSKSSANSDEISKSLYVGTSVRDLQDEGIKEIDDPVESYPCPMCGKFFTSILIDDHAYDCQGKSDTECATAFKCDNESILECAEQNDETFVRPIQNEISPKEMMNSRISRNSNSEVALLTSFPLKELRVELIDFRKLRRNIRERPL